MIAENATLWPGPNAARLVLTFEVRKLDDSILKSRICEGGKYEIGFGNTYYEDGSPVKAGETITMERAYAMRAMALRRNWMPVQAALQFVPTQNQVDALAVAAYNLGGEMVANANAIVGNANAKRWEDAAAGFSEYIGARSPGPSEREIRDGMIPKSAPEWRRIDGKPRWLDANGQPCIYFRRLRGLLRRRHAEACLFLGYGWEEAVEDDRVSLSTERFWNEKRGWWEDRVREKTEFSSIYAIASKYPLASAPIAQQPDPPKAPAPVVPVEVAPLPEIAKPSDPKPEVLPPPPLPKEKPVTTPSAPQPKLPDDFDPNAGVKAMVYSRRFWGWLLIILGRFSFVTDAGAGTLAQTGGVVGQFANSIAGDPLLLDAYTGFAVMMTGEAVRWWGEKKATKALK